MSSYNGQWRKLRKEILRRDQYTCHYCSREANTVDHLIPLIKGGTNHETNLVAACSKCNYAKQDQDEIQFKVKQHAKNYTNKRDFFVRDETPLTPPHKLSPRDFGVFEPLENERKLQDAS